MSLTSSNNGWYKGWFYLRNGPEFPLPAYTGNPISQSRRNRSDEPCVDGVFWYTKHVHYTLVWI
jgi:hypothetical protein